MVSVFLLCFRILLHFYTVTEETRVYGHILDTVQLRHELSLYQTSVFSCEFWNYLHLKAVICAALKGQLLHVDTKCSSTL